MIYYSAMKDSCDRTLRIGHHLYTISAAGRTRLSGILRYFAEHSECDAVLVDVSPGCNENATVALDGLLCYNLHKFEPSVRRRLARLRAVYIDSPPMMKKANNIDQVRVDNGLIGATAADLLVRRGYRNFAYVGPIISIHLNAWHSNQRYEAFSKRLAESAMSCCARYDFGNGSIYDEAEALSRFVAALPKPCGIFAYCDTAAQQVYDACRMAKVSIPGTVSVVGVDNQTEICESLRPTLTSIQPDFELCGYLAAELLMRRIRNPQAAPKKITYGIRRLFERESTLDIDGTARLATQARTYIAENYMRPLSVLDVARKLNTCRRGLEVKFRKATGRTVQKEIERVRLEAAKSMLRGTNRPICEIAAECGYGAISAFRLAFSKSVRCSPRAFRNSASR